ncbi:hypothetical protein C1645_737211 [Glomus cerebriforme]|uniref:Uncharacterized protein n=1 Tax=Glomus cerebriforme TaxID=658196 RepID=A0A397T306_9GLOM|nr:hypothetical protein C1645_737211 [Glomus cerebriforme]
MARKFIISLFVVIFFIITFTNSLPLEENSISQKEENSIDKRAATPPFFVLYADFIPGFDPYGEVDHYVTGRFTFTRLQDNTTIRVIGQCNTGFTDPNPNLYTIIISPRPICPIYNKRLDLTPFLKYFINVPGTSGMQYDFPNMFTMEEIHHQFLIVLLGGTPIGSAYIQGIGDE